MKPETCTALIGFLIGVASVTTLYAKTDIAIVCLALAILIGRLE